MLMLVHRPFYSFSVTDFVDFSAHLPTPPFILSNLSHFIVQQILNVKKENAKITDEGDQVSDNVITARSKFCYLLYAMVTVKIIEHLWLHE